MKLRVLLESLFPAASSIDVGVGNLVLLGQTMGKDDHVLAMEEVENPVVDPPLTRAQLMNAVPEIVGFRPAESILLGTSSSHYSNFEIGTTFAIWH
jgi:hypothetical protein